MVTKVLLIDDDPDEHTTFVTALKRYNHNILCITVQSWREVATVAGYFLPDIIFLDYYMPWPDGLETLKQIKKSPAFKETKVYIYSIAPVPKGTLEIFRFGASKWIEKPGNIEEYSIMFNDALSEPV